MTPSRGMTGSR